MHVRERFTEGQIETCLRALVLADLNVRIAHERIVASGMPGPPSFVTLNKWKNRYSERIATLVEDRDAWVSELLAQKYDFLAAGALQVQEKMIEEILSRKDWKRMNIQSLGLATKAMATTAAIDTDKARLLRDKPTKISRNEASIDDLLKQLERKFGDVVEVKRPELIESTAEEEAA